MKLRNVISFHKHAKTKKHFQDRHFLCLMSSSVLLLQECTDKQTDIQFKRKERKTHPNVVYHCTGYIQAPAWVNSHAQYGKTLFIEKASVPIPLAKLAMVTVTHVDFAEKILGTCHARLELQVSIYVREKSR